jgi:hypothetical protein
MNSRGKWKSTGFINRQFSFQEKGTQSTEAEDKETLQMIAIFS